MVQPGTAAAAAHLALRWRDDVIAVTRAGSDGPRVNEVAPFPCPPALVGFVFARVERGVPTAFAPAGHLVTVWRGEHEVDLVEGPCAIPLAAGSRAELAIGEFVLAASAGASEALPPPRKRMAGVSGVALAALAHALVLGLAAHDARASSAEAEDERIDTLRKMLVAAEMREREVDPPPIADTTGRGEARKEDKKRGDGRASSGERARGDDGRMGDRLSRPDAHGHYALPRDTRKDAALDVTPDRPDALADASAFGMIGLLASAPNATRPSATGAWAQGSGFDAVAVDGELWSRHAGEAWGEAGLGLSGIGYGGGGSGDGIGLGRLGTLGHGDGRPGAGLGGEGSPRLHGSHRLRIYRCTGVSCTISGRLPPETVRRIVRQNFGRFRACYEAGLLHDPALAGTVTTRFIIGRDGAVSNVGGAGSTLPDTAVSNCVHRAFYGLSFPQPDGGIVTVSYPIAFSPG